VSAANELDITRIIETLDRHRVEYLVVGGVAAYIYGATRLTSDADTVIRRSTANLQAVAEALQELKARYLVEGLSDEESQALPIVLDGRSLASFEISTWRTDAGDLDILVEIPAADGTRRTYDDLLPNATEGTFGPDNTIIRVAGLEDIIGSKQWADRPKDHEALPELRSLRAKQADNDAQQA
jgi:hypothetical protein